jgi:hypothetical protein
MKGADRLLLAAAVVVLSVFAATKAWADDTTPSTPPTTAATATTATTWDPSAPPPTAAPAPDWGPSPWHNTGHGLFDPAGFVRDAIDGWFSHLAAAALDPLLRLLGRTAFSTPNFTGAGRVRDLWLVSWGIANSLFVLFVVGAGVLGMSYETLQTRYAVKDLLPRVAVAFISANASLFLAGFAINVANALSEALASEGVGAARGAASVVLVLVEGAVDGGSVFLRILGLVVAALVLGVLATWVGRLATMVVLVGGAPLFLACHALPGADGAARLWWRALVGCLAVQVGQALVLVTGVRVLLDADGRRTVGLSGGPLVDLLVVGALFWMMLRLPSYARRLVFTPRSNIAGQAARHAVFGKALSAVKAAA